jgi:hypothetical protein
MVLQLQIRLTFYHPNNGCTNMNISSDSKFLSYFSTKTMFSEGSFFFVTAINSPFQIQRLAFALHFLQFG